MARLARSSVLALVLLAAGSFFSISRAQSPVISGTTPVTATVGLPFAYNITANNTPTGFNATGLPAGLFIDTYTGVVWGTPTASGTSTITLSATNASGTGTAPLTVTLNPQPVYPVITSATVAAARVGVAYSFIISATNSPTSYSATGLPAGLTLDTVHGVISGSPATVGSSTVTLGAANGSGTGTSTLVLTVTNEIGKGACVGWLQQMDATGFQFYENSGQQLDPDQTINCLKILRARNIDSLRLRVFVPPQPAGWNNIVNGNCNVREVTAVAAKAKALGFRIDVDLCYCWSFADPGGQKIPINWVTEANQAMANPPAGLTAQQAGLQVLVSEVSKHTTEVLTQMKAAGVTPEWVQVGNEITNGILDQDGNAYPAAPTSVTYGGSTSNWPQLVQIVNAGYAAVKAVDPNIKVVIHIDRAHSDSLDKGFYSNLQKYGGKWDISGTDCDSGTLTDIASTMNDLAATFNQPGQGGAGVMMCEVEPPGVFDGNGNYAPNPNFDWMTGVFNLMRAVPGNKGIAALYWEPEAEHDWNAGWPQSAWVGHEPCSALDSMRPSILQTNGLNIVDGLNVPIQLKGVNLGGLMLMEPWMTPADSSGLPDEYSIINQLDTRFGVTTEQSLIQTYRQSWMTSQDFDNIKAQGLNVIRVPVWWGDFYTLSALGTSNPVMRSDAFTELDSIVETAAERGIRTVIDMHGVFGGQSTSNDTGYQNQNQYWTNANDQANTQAMWSVIAAHYNGNAWVAGYDLLNEPSGAPNNAAVVTQLNSLYTTVRAADPSHIIFMEGTFGSPWGWGELPSPSSQGWTNVVYEMHEYQFNNETISGVEAGADNQVADFNSHASYNVPAYIGEFNAFGTGTAAWQYVVNDFNNANMSWSSWSYKATHGAAPDSWGLYDPTGTWTTVPNIMTDASSTISTDWSKWTTANTFALNPMISGVLVGPSSISSLPVASTGAGNPFTFQITATGSPTSFSATNLPAGLTLNSTTGVISGTTTDPNDPTHTTIQTSIIGLTVNFAGGGSSTGALLLTIYPAGPVITSNLNQSATVGVAFNLYIATGSELGSLEEIAAPGTQLPPGLTISVPGNGLISGTPTTSGTYTAELAACNQWGIYGTPVLMKFTVHPPANAPVISSAFAATTAVGNAFSYNITASNTPTSYAATSLPTGLSVSTTSGLISGTPTATGTYTIGISATNSHGTDTETLTLTVNPQPPSITSATTASGGMGLAFNYILAASNSPTSFSATGLPAGMTLNTATGVISGSPTTAGTYVVTLSASNAGGTGSTTFTITVNATSPSSLVWAGTTSQAWDVTTANWKAGTASTAYADDTIVSFDDTGTGGTIALAGAYSPASLTVASSSKSYSIAGPGSLNGPMLLTKSGSSTLSMNSPNFYTGGTQLLAGQLSISATTAALGAGPLIFGSTGDASTVVVRAAGINLPNAISAYPGGTRWIEPGSGSAVTYTGAVSLNGGATLGLSTVGGNVTLGGSIAGTGNILFGENGGARSSREFLTGASVNMVGTISDAGNPDTGGCTVSGAIGTNVTGITQGSTSESMTLTGTNTFNGPMTITSGTLTLSGTGIVGGGSYTGAIADGGTFVYSSTATQILGGVISGAGTINISGGQVVLSASNTFTGTALVNSGTLVVTGALAGGTVTVNTGGTLSGTGTIGGATSLNTGGSLTPGSLGTGTLTLSGGLQMASASNLNISLGTSGTSGLLALTGGSFTPPSSGQVTVNITATGAPLAGTYPLVTGVSGISASTFTLASAPSGTGFTYSLSASGSTLSLVVTPPPLAPTNLVASAMGAGIALNWSSSTYASSYAVGRSTVSGGPYTIVATGATTNFIDSSVTSGLAYYYVVSASDSAGTSSYSNEASAAALTAFQQWLVAGGLPAGTTPSAQPDNDGLSLLMKYATGLTPGTPSAAGPAQIALSGDFLAFNFNRLALAPVNYLVESSSDLVHWTSLVSLAAGSSGWTGTATVTETGTNPVSVTVTDTASLSGGTAPRFLRLRTTTSTDTSEPSTVPMGNVPVALTGAATSATSLPLDNAPVERNAISSVATSSLMLPNPGSWATSAQPCALRLLSGHGSGATFAITGQSGNVLALNTQGVDLTQLVAVGDLYEILPLTTLGSLYGTNAPVVQTGSSAATGDNVLVWNGTTWLTYFNNGTTWKQSGSLLSQNNTPLSSSTGLLVTRRGSSPLNYQVIGRVPEVALNQFTNPGGNTFLGSAYPLATTLSATGFATASGWQSGASAASADNVLCWNGSTWLTFFFNGTNWKQSGSLLNQNSYPLAPAQPLMIQRRSSPSPSNAFVPQPLNYTP